MTSSFQKPIIHNKKWVSLLGGDICKKNANLPHAKRQSNK